MNEQEDDRANQANAIVDHKMLKTDGLLSEEMTSQLLSLYDIVEPPMHLIEKKDDISQCLEHIGLPVVMKLSSPDITDTSSINAVRVNITTRSEALAAYDDILSSASTHAPAAGVRGVLIRRYFPESQEVSLVTRREEDEIVLTIAQKRDGVEQSKTSARLPLTPESLHSLLSSCEQVRQGTELWSSLGNCIQSVASLAMDVPTLQSIDFNPALLCDDGIVVVDPKLTLKRDNYRDAD